MIPEKWFREEAPKQRWFADKAKTVDEISVIWSLQPVPDSEFVLYLTEMGFDDGSRSLYLAALDGDCTRDVTGDPGVTSWLLGALLNVVALPPELTWDHLATFPKGVGLAPGRALGVQQSNTSIRYPGDLLIKVNRRLTSGISPEVELSAVMQRSADRNATTTTYGSLWLETPELGRACLAVASQFVPNQGDGWSTMLKLLGDVYSREDFAPSLNEVAAIAELTASMHRALAADPWQDSVAPELIVAEDVARWSSSSVRELDTLLEQLEQLQSGPQPETANLIDLVPRAVPELRRRMQGFGALLGTHRLRIHGDYHLGQVLRKSDGSYVAIDFDGEPARPLRERRQKYSALRDVAGMLRSLAYARGTVEVEHGRPGIEVSILHEWESAARERFMEIYVRGVSHQPFKYLPSPRDDVRQALGALELEKTIYECRYEINNRPEWLWLPLSRLIQES